MRCVVGVVLALGLAAASASAHPTAAGAVCKPGLKSALVGGLSACLKTGQTCSARFLHDYLRAGFACESGRLRNEVRSAPPAGTSEGNPVPLGHPASLGNGWILIVTAVNTDATTAILAADPANKPPPAGLQDVLVSITATYTGSGSSHLTPGSTLHAVGASGVRHSSADSFCGTLPDPNLDGDNPLVYKGNTVSGYAACFMVAPADVPSLELYYQQPLSSTQVWFSLH
ncbi:MAG: hypothetical protein JO186_09250 [Actinobacteria bacterium]|nr:hypothetical protein [Actinomycetota bacterium]MBV8396960.1 hypothetical protein [Actinomycetota bacterium]MBV8598420.1 hypothetical protein [Actinomycetota bacterium]